MYTVQTNRSLLFLEKTQWLFSIEVVIQEMELKYFVC